MSNQRDFTTDHERGDHNAAAEGASSNEMDSNYDNGENDYARGTANGASRIYARDAITAESGYGAGEVGSINQGSERGGVTTGSDADTDTYADSNASASSDAAPSDVPGHSAVRRAGNAMANSGMGARYSEANANAGELNNSDQGYATGLAGGSGSDEARSFRTSSDPEYGERDMGYGHSLDQPESSDHNS